MRIAVVGATGRTGARLVELALAEGHTVRALTRRRPATPSEGNLVWVEGDVLDPSSVARLASGSEVVVVALGPVHDSPPDLCSRGTKAVIAACRAFRIGRLVVLTGAMIGHPRDKMAVMLRSMAAMYGLVRRSSLADRRLQEELVMGSGLGWTLVRPPRLVDGDPSGQLLAGSELFVHATAYATTGDVARVLLDAAVHGRWAHSGVVVISGEEVAAEVPADDPASEEVSTEALAEAVSALAASDSGSVPTDSGTRSVPTDSGTRSVPTDSGAAVPPVAPSPPLPPEPAPAPVPVAVSFVETPEPTAPSPAPAPVHVHVPVAPPPDPYRRPGPVHETPQTPEAPPVAAEAPVEREAPVELVSATVEWEPDDDWPPPAPGPQGGQLPHPAEPALVRDGDDDAS